LLPARDLDIEITYVPGCGRVYLKLMSTRADLALYSSGAGRAPSLARKLRRTAQRAMDGFENPLPVFDVEDASWSPEALIVHTPYLLGALRLSGLDHALHRPRTATDVAPPLPQHTAAYTPLQIMLHCPLSRRGTV
jgi:hypothetical protein